QPSVRPRRTQGRVERIESLPRGYRLRARVCQVDTRLEPDGRIADGLSLHGQLLQRRSRFSRVSASEGAARKLNLGEERKHGEARGPKNAASIGEQVLGLVELSPANEDLGETCVGVRSVVPVAGPQAVLVGADVQLDCLVPLALGV